ncbi:trehalase-like domain-containing protein [Dictyobacter vulcani]|uniref:trehalase-like domain-containing protein n=1 Tax=Dictyobacter vulcani TaxID=2607529 RepID=UPI0035308BCC
MVGKNELNRTYLPINSYGVIGDCHSAVLVSPDGSVDWGCLPDFDSPAIFCRLLDAERVVSSRSLRPKEIFLVLSVIYVEAMFCRRALRASRARSCSRTLCRLRR